MGKTVGIVVLLLLCSLSISQAMTTSGAVRTLVDSQGRFAIMVDRQNDGLADDVFLFSQATAINATASVQLEFANVEYSNDRVAVTTANHSVYVEAAVGNPTPADWGAVSYRFLGGAELVYIPLDNTASMNGLWLGGILGGLSANWGCNGDGCAGGGPGSTGCSAGTGSGTCSVSCGAGYHACCNPGSCKCHAN